MPDTVTADEIKTLLKLEPNATCGFVRETYKSDLMIAPGGLPAPFEDGRPLGTALYFMVTPDAPVKLHRIKNEQLYHYYLGDPIEVLLLRENGDSELLVVGPNIVGGHMLQLYIPGNTFHTARVTGKRRWFLGASTEWPGVVQRDRDVELGDVDQLAAKYSRKPPPTSAAIPRSARLGRSRSKPGLVPCTPGFLFGLLPMRPTQAQARLNLEFSGLARSARTDLTKSRGERQPPAATSRDPWSRRRAARPCARRDSTRIRV